MCIYSFRGGGDLSRLAVSKALRAAKGKSTAEQALAAVLYGATSRDGRYAALGCLAFGVLLGVTILLVIYARLAYVGETSLEKSARETRHGPDYRTYPKWQNVFALSDAPRLTPSSVLAELRDAGHFIKLLADEDGGSPSPPPSPRRDAPRQESHVKWVKRRGPKDA